MAAIETINDQNWKTTFNQKPALILFTNGDGVRGDFITQFKKSAAENNTIVFAEANPETNPELAEKFNTGKKPLLVGYYNDEMLVRRSRPWGTDVVLAIELLETTYKEQPMADTTVAEETQLTEAQPTAIANNTPVAVTDNTFQEMVVDYSNEMPVLVDFWAEWCGPCRMVAPILDTLAEEYAGQIRIAKVDVDQNQGLAQAFRVMSIPTIMAFKDGQMIFSQPGAFPEEAFRDLISQIIALDVQAAIAEQEGTAVEEAIEEDIEEAVAETEEAIEEEIVAEAEEAAIAETEAIEVIAGKPVAVTDNSFQEMVVDYSNEMPVLVDFWAEWCGPCRMVAPILDTIAAEYEGQIRIAKVDVDQNPGLSQAFRVMSIPTIMAFKDGHMIFSQPGAFPEEAFRDLVDQIIALDVQAAIAEHEAQEAAAEGETEPASD